MAMALAVAVPAGAQTRDENRMFVSLFGGLVESRDLWRLDAQRVGVLAGGNEVGVDTFRIVRRARPGPILGMNLFMFKNPNLGWGLEFSYIGLGTRDECSVRYTSPESALQGNINEDYCDQLGGQRSTIGSINFMGGLAWRPWTRAFANPYVRVMAGVADQNGTTIEVDGPFSGGNRVLILDPGSSGIRPTGGLALGIMIPTAPGYQFRFEARDQVYWRDVPDGPANELAIAPTSWKMTHNWILSAAVDIVLERRRGRRY